MIVDENTLMAWIADWETEGVEFKNTLNIESKDDKGEFVKDVIALANSAPDAQGYAGYLVVGVSNEKMIVGTDLLEEERIQQIVHTYVHPRLALRCSTLSTQAPGWLQVGIIEIAGLDRPYSISRAIGKWQQGDVFIRNGSVVSRATKEDIIRMNSEAQGTAEVRQLIKSAETQMDLENYQEAIETYTLALRLRSSAGLFLARGKARRKNIESNVAAFNDRKRDAALAIKDLSDALALSESFALQKEVRFERVRLQNLTFVDYKDSVEDYDWLKENTTGQEFGEALFRDYWTLEGNLGIAGDRPTEVLLAMDTVLEHGFSDAGVFQLRARSKFELHDCNMALQDIDAALKMTGNPWTQIDILTLRATILTRMCRFEEAYESFRSARQLYSSQYDDRYNDPLGYIASDLEDEILWRYALEAEFGSPGGFSSGRAVVSALLEDIGTQKRAVIVGQRLQAINGVTWVLSRYRPVLGGLKNIVGKDFWNRWRGGQA